MAATTQTHSTISTRTTRRYWRRADEPRPWWPWGLLPLLGLLLLFLIGTLIMAPAIEDEVRQGVGKALAGAGVSVRALAADGQGVTARIGGAGPDISFLKPLAGATGVRDEAKRVRQACNEALQDALSETSIRFRTASAVIDTGNDALLRRLAGVVNDCPGALTVEGHTDSQGDADMNEALSQARADAVRNALAGLGVDSARMRAVGYGETRPVADNSAAEGRAANRRIVIAIDEPE